MAGDDHLQPGLGPYHQQLNLTSKPRHDKAGDQQIWTELIKNNQKQTLQDRIVENGVENSEAG